MKLRHEQKAHIENYNYGMFDTLSNYMVGKSLLDILEAKNITMQTSMEDIIAIARSIGDKYPDSEASDTVVREAIVGVLIDLAKETV